MGAGASNDFNKGAPVAAPTSGSATGAPLSSSAAAKKAAAAAASSAVGSGGASQMRRPNNAPVPGPAPKKPKQGTLKDVTFVEASKYGSLNEFAFFDKVR